MAKLLIPRSDSISAKVIEPSDFEKLFSHMADYVKSGYALSAGTGLAVNIASGEARLKGLSCQSTATESVSSLSANELFISNVIGIGQSRLFFNLFFSHTLL